MEWMVHLTHTVNQLKHALHISAACLFISLKYRAHPSRRLQWHPAISQRTIWHTSPFHWKPVMMLNNSSVFVKSPHWRNVFHYCFHLCPHIWGSSEFFYVVFHHSKFQALQRAGGRTKTHAAHVALHVIFRGKSENIQRVIQTETELLEGSETISLVE